MRAFVALLSLLVAGPALALEDTTPPQLISFSISPVVVDSSLTDTVLDWSITASDDLSGLSGGVLIVLARVSPPGTGILPVFTSGGGNSFLPDGLLLGTVSGQVTIPRYSPSGSYMIEINQITDRVGNYMRAANPDAFQPGTFPAYPNDVNLCSFGPCVIQVVPEPSPALFLGLGLVGLAIGRSHARSSV